MPEQSFETLGQYLRREREMRGISLAEISAGTKVKLAFLQEIEDGRHDRLPSPIYVQGFLRSYARFIGLGEGEVLQRYKEAAAQAAVERQAMGVRPPASEARYDESARAEGTGSLIDQILGPADDWRMKDRRQDLIVSGIFGVREGRNRVRRRSMVIGSALGAGAAVLLGVYLVVQLFATPKETVIAYRENMARSLAPQPSQPVRNTGRSLSASPSELDTLPSDKMVTAPAPPAPEPPVLAKPVVPPLPTPPPAPVVAVPPPVPHHKLIIEASEKSWLQVEIDDGATKEFLLTAGDKVELRAERGFELTVGNAGGVVLTLDGKKRPPLGDHGVVVRNLKLP
jgi:cytoskeleton protein RodZ